MKIVNDIVRQGVIEPMCGHEGGLRLRKNLADARIGDMLRTTETDFSLAA